MPSGDVGTAELDGFVRMDVSDSELCDGIGYNLAKLELEVSMVNGHVYVYYPVDPLTALAFSEATSKGQYYNTYIKRVYKERKVV